MRRVARVEDNNDSKKQGRVQVRIYPEFESLDQASLPWAEPYIEGDICIPGNNPVGKYSIPEKGSFIVVEIDSTWQEFHYLGLTPKRDRGENLSDITKELSNLTDVDITYPQPLYLLRSKDGSIAYHNTDTGELGIVSSKGVFVSFDSEGNLNLGSKDGSIMKFSSNGELTFTGKVNSAGSSFALFEPLKEILEKLLTHIHVAPNGPTTAAQESTGVPLSTLKSKIQEMETK